MAELEVRIIKLPIPARQLHPNSRVHFRARSNYTKDHRTCAKAMAEALFPDSPQWRKVVVRPVFHFAQNRRRDVDGMVSSLKAYMDGITDSGLIEDDSYVSWLPPLHDVDKNNPHVELRFYHGTLKPLEPEELIDPA